MNLLSLRMVILPMMKQQKHIHINLILSIQTLDLKLNLQIYQKLLVLTLYKHQVII